MEYCTCGSLKADGICTNRNCSSSGDRRKGWQIDGAFLDFNKPVTYVEALDVKKKMDKLYKDLE